MSTRRPEPPAETRAEVARRRLAQLAASFEETTGGGAEPVPDRPPRGPRHSAAPDRGSADRTGADRGDPDAVDDRADAPGERWRESVAHVPRLGPAHLRVLATLAAAAGVLLTWWLLAERPRTASVDEALPTPVAETTADGEGAPGPATGPDAHAEVVVDVAGKVRDPGIVALPAGSRVHEAIEAAGGAGRGVDLTSLNLARVLVDGEQVLVGVEPVAAPAGAAPGSASAPGAPAGAPVSLNTATMEQLDALPGVGPVTAQAILDWRTENGRFGSVDDLLEVSGIGDKTLDELRDLVTV